VLVSFLVGLRTYQQPVILMEGIPLCLWNIQHYGWIIIYCQLNFTIHRDQLAESPREWIWIVIYCLDLLGHAYVSRTAVWNWYYKNFPSSVYTWKASGMHLCYCGIFHVCVFMWERNVRPSAVWWKVTETPGLQASHSRILFDRWKECFSVA